MIDSVTIRRVGKGYLVSYSEVSKKDGEDVYDYTEEVFLDSQKASDFLAKKVKSL